ncbi:MAG: hypothetical protein ACK40S_10540 [Burkholderiaceae bacterium]
MRPSHSTFCTDGAVRVARTGALGLSLLWALGTLPAVAHETHDHSIQEDNGLQLQAAAAVSYLHASQAVPAARLPGHLGLGDTPDDQRGWALEHATVGASMRLGPLVGAQVAWGKHGRDTVHTEAAWLALRPSADSSLTLGAGRNRVPMGGVLTDAGHLDRFAQTPLVKRSVFNGDWVEDGVQLAWRPRALGHWEWFKGLDVGLWRARRFPGSENAAWAPMVHVSGAGPLAWAAGRWEADAFVSRLQPQGRGAYVQSGNSGHLHTAPDCSTTLRGITCFDGTVNLAGASLRWLSALPGVTLTAAGLMRDERGSLYSQNGDTRYQGRTRGGWLEAGWQPAAQWEIGLRQEWLRSAHRLQGPGAALVAADANLTPYHPARRVTAMLGWRPHADWLLALEAGRERTAGQAYTVGALRVVYIPRPLAAARW